VPNCTISQVDELKGKQVIFAEYTETPFPPCNAYGKIKGQSVKNFIISVIYLMLTGKT
jgi:hypothetical protein